MKRSALFAAVMAAVMAVSTAGAMAQPRDRDGGHGRGDRVERGPDARHGAHRPDPRGWRDDHRGPPRHPHGGPPGHAKHARHALPPPPPHHWKRGDRLPQVYRERYYVVDDWRGHRLHAPPRGQRWVQVGADYALVAIATGVIAQIILNR